MPTPTDLVTDLPADFEVFGQAVDSTMADLKGGTSGQILSKNSNTDMDFVWITNDQGDITGVTATSPLTGGGTSGAITVGIQDGTTSQKGALQLTDSTSSTSTTTAATPNAVKSAYDFANRPNPSNPFLNSAMQVWQRGTSFALGSGGFYTADRWYTFKASGNHTISRQATGDTTNLPFIQYAARIQRNSGQTDTGRSQFYQCFETVNTIPFAGKTVTISFYARAGANYSPTSSNLEYYFGTGTGTDQNPINGYTGSAQSAAGNVVLTTTWQRFSITGTVASTATEMYFVMLANWAGTAGANDYYEVTGVQMDVGSVALPFRTYAATIQGELAACQRYYEKSYDTGTAPTANTTAPGLVAATAGAALGNGVTFASVRFKTEKRATPTVTIYSYSNGLPGVISNGNGGDLASNSGIAQHQGTSSFNVYNNSGGSISPAQNCFIFHYVASSEL